MKVTGLQLFPAGASLSPCLILDVTIFLILNILKEVIVGRRLAVALFDFRCCNIFNFEYFKGSYSRPAPRCRLV